MQLDVSLLVALDALPEEGSATRSGGPPACHHPRDEPKSGPDSPPSWTPRPGKLKMTLASGCWTKDSSTASASASAARQAASNCRRRAKACLPSASSTSCGWLA